MGPILTGIILLVAGLAGVFWGYRIFRFILPVIGGIAGYLIGLALFPNNLIIALVIGFGLAILFAILAFAAWSVMVTISGAVLGAALGVAIAVGLNLTAWLGWIVILALAVLVGILVWKIRDEVVIILTAITGAAFVATGLRVWFGAGTIRSLVWWTIFFVLAVIGIVWQWQRYRNLKLLGMGGPAKTPGVEPVAPAAAVSAEVAAPAVAAPAVAATAAAVTETRSEEISFAAEPEAFEVEAAVPEVEAVAPEIEVAAPEIEVAVPEIELAAPMVEAAAVGAVIAEAAEEARLEESVLPEAAPEAAAGAVIAEVAEEARLEEPVLPEAAPEAALVEAAALSHLDLLESSLEGSQLANLQEKVEFVEGIGPTFGLKLNEAGIATVLDLLRRGATRKGRTELAEITGIAAGLIMKWVNQADLYRVKGIGKQFGELLEAAGVDTVPELAQRNPQNLFNKLSEVNAEKKLAGRAPHQSEVESWVAQAKDLPRVIEY